jgi:hypothetical protein
MHENKTVFDKQRNSRHGHKRGVGLDPLCISKAKDQHWYEVNTQNNNNINGRNLQ